VEVKRKKLVDMDRDELLEVIGNLVVLISSKKGRDLQPNREANRRHQYAKHVWGRKKLVLLNMLDMCWPHVPKEFQDEITAILDHEEDNYQRRDAIRRRCQTADSDK
jgi:hypothetical protein